MGTVTDSELMHKGLNTGDNNERLFEGPLHLSGALEKYTSFDVTPIIIGREFPDASLRDLIETPDSDTFLRDLAIMISQRGVVFFRKQNDLTDELQKFLVQRLRELTSKPKTSKLHIHPLFYSALPMGGDDDKLNIISTAQDQMVFKSKRFVKRQSARQEWHTDILHEIFPSDYSLLRLVELPKGGGGDTLWASGYEIYDRISKPYQRFLETLTATCTQPSYKNLAKKMNYQLYTEPRGSPENTESTAAHPVIRTNPVAGWKSLFTAGRHVKRINDLEPTESENLLRWFMDSMTGNHDLQVRNRWQSPNDVAIWDNRSVFHTGTQNIDIDGERVGHRASGIGERPYLDPASSSRREALGLL
ncbi:TauD/TfdA dioxygenase family protein [Aspergillus affinis]|uniref:TauD/TfdA dioxygenase family protein n=1 Tax=Aspergillus affinis TaxID=1070780 RepID=UPI0022FDDA5B|nr:taurine catabolism dioxygenase [Aspergillus affinis]KAI9038845.1 taurine catabolism dioxygenase [Aspergillus affinis]